MTNLLRNRFVVVAFVIAIACSGDNGTAPDDGGGDGGGGDGKPTTSDSLWAVDVTSLGTQMRAVHGCSAGGAARSAFRAGVHSLG